jgi:hypothetical protein
MHNQPSKAIHQNSSNAHKLLIPDGFVLSITANREWLLVSKFLNLASNQAFAA